MLEDYRFSKDMAYISHRLMVRGKDIEIGGVLGAALVSALLVDTDEGNRRGIAIDSEAEQIAWIKKYEREVPGSQPRAPKHRNYIVKQETDWGFVMDEVNALNEDSQRLFAQWMLDWQRFVTKHLKPQKPVRFWTEKTPELQQRQLAQYLRLQEKEWDYYKCLSAAIYAMRQMGYVRRACSVPDITRWMSEELVKDYTTKNNRNQFRRAWNELGRYHEDVRYFVQELQYLLEA